MKPLKFLSGNFLFDSNPYHIRYQIPRTLIAAGQLMTLFFTDRAYLFNTISEKPLNLFSTDYGIWSAVIVLIWVISGILPQVSALLHFYITYSFFIASDIIEGGDQVAQIITLLLIPVCLLDKRINLWSSKKYFHYQTPEIFRLFTRSCLKVIQIQMAIVYLFAGAVKINVSYWAEGSAMYYWFNHTMGASDSPAVQFLFGGLMRSHFFSPIITWCVLILEFLLFGALFMERKFRNTLFVPAVVFHFFIGIVFGLWAFGMTMTAGLMLFLLPRFLYEDRAKVEEKLI